MTEYLFSPPPGKDLIPFQEEGIIQAHHILTDEQGDQAVDLQYEMGLGKSVVSMALAGLLFEDDLIDHVLVVAEANKVRDWAEDDFPSWTSLSVLRYAGTKAQRERMRKDLPQVIVMTYETGREDIAAFKHAKKSQGYAITGPGPLAEALKGKRVLVVFDEVTKLRSRDSRTHIAWNYLVNRWLRRRKDSSCMAMGLTGTKIESSPQDHYNVNRILAPGLSPLVKDFEAVYVDEVDEWSHKPLSWKNLDQGHGVGRDLTQHREPGHDVLVVQGLDDVLVQRPLARGHGDEPGGVLDLGREPADDVGVVLALAQGDGLVEP